MTGVDNLQSVDQDSNASNAIILIFASVAFIQERPISICSIEYLIQEVQQFSRDVLDESDEGVM